MILSLSTVAGRIGFSSADDLYNTLGYGGVSLQKLVIKMREEVSRVITPDPEPVEVTEENMVQKAKPKHLKSNSGIIVDGESGCAVKFAKCCNPLPGDEVIGFITKGYGISIHKKDCPNAIAGKTNPESADRWISARWESAEDSGSSKNVYEALLQVFTEDKIGMLANIAVALADMKVMILQVNSRKKNNGDSIIDLKVSCKNIDHYYSIVSRLKSLDGVIDVARGFSS